MQPQGSFSFLQTGQQDGQHGFLHMETVLGLVKDLVGVLFKDSGGNLLAPVRRQTVEEHGIGLCALHQPASHLKAREVPQAALTFGVPGAVFHAAVTTTSASFTPSAGSVSR